jgi:transaldolase
MKKRAEQLHDLGQSVWLDFISREVLRSGEFDRLVTAEGVMGVTSNPTIFQQAIADSEDYDDALNSSIARGIEGAALFEAIAVEDIQDACNRLRPVFDRTGGCDGRVSIEVSPHLAHDSRATIEEARRLHRSVSRDNLMVKVPATVEGLDAIRTLTAEGLCINVTLIFSLSRYGQVMDAYLSGLELRAKKGEPLDRIFSVASFFVSRVDTKVDKAIDQALQQRQGPERAELENLRGKAAIANARLAYALFLETFAAPRFAALGDRGARRQRPLWASTSTKNPRYPDTMYVDELIGSDTVNTMPPQTLAAFNDHGTVEVTIGRDLEAARRLFRRLPELGIPVDRLIEELESEGVQAFAKSYDALLEALATKRRELVSSGRPR